MIPQKGVRPISLVLAISTGLLISTLNTKYPLSSAVAQTANTRKAEADRLYQQCKDQVFQTSQFEAAIQSCQKALAIYLEIQDRQGEGLALKDLGNAYYFTKKYAQAFDYQQKALLVARAIKDRQLEGAALTNLGNADSALGDFSKAIDYYQKSLTITQEIKDYRVQEIALSNLGRIYSENLKDFPRAISYYQQSLDLNRRIGDREGEAETLSSLAITYNHQGNNAKAIEYGQKSLAIARELGDSKAEQQLLGLIANYYHALGEYATAIEYGQKSLTLAQKLGEREEESNALGDLGLVYEDMGEYAKSIKYQQESLSISKEIGDRVGEMLSLNLLGNVYRNSGEYARAMQYYEQSLVLVRKLNDLETEGIVLGNLGNVYYALGDYAKAIAHRQQSLDIARKVKNSKLERGNLANIGLVYADTEEYKQAIEYYEKALALAKMAGDRNIENAILGNLGTVYRKLGDLQQSIAYHEQSLAISREIGDQEAEGNALGNLGLVYNAQGNYAKAVEYHRKSLNIARRIGNRLGQSSQLNNLGLSLITSGKYSEAESILFESIQILEYLREALKNDDKVSIFEIQSKTYRLLQEALIAQKRFDQALEVSERSRTRAFAELLEKRLSPNWSDRFKLNPPNIRQIKQLAKARNATLVEYSIIQGQSNDRDKQEPNSLELYIWVVKPTGEVSLRKSIFTLLDQQTNLSIATLITNSRSGIGVGNRATLIVAPTKEARRKASEQQAAILQRLHKLLIEPVSDLLPSDPKQYVIFIPQGELFLVPFSALQDQNGKYLLEKHTILTAASIQILDLTRQQKNKITKTGNALVMGNPAMPSVLSFPGEQAQKLPSLPGAEKEAIAIAPLLNTQAITGNQGTKSAIVQGMPHARIIHLATHGILDDLRGIGSAIALAPDPGKPPQDELGRANGLLTAEEILDMKLNADLVVLSACDTGRGRITGDGVIGLSRSFISAGVPSIIVSLWAVPDAPTAELMTEFYTNWQVKKLDKAQALRQAMLTTMKTHPNPRDWAAFTLIGEAE